MGHKKKKLPPRGGSKAKAEAPPSSQQQKKNKNNTKGKSPAAASTPLPKDTVARKNREMQEASGVTSMEALCAVRRANDLAIRAAPPAPEAPAFSSRSAAARALIAARTGGGPRVASGSYLKVVRVSGGGKETRKRGRETRDDILDLLDQKRKADAASPPPKKKKKKNQPSLFLMKNRTRARRGAAGALTTTPEESVSLVPFYPKGRAASSRTTSGSRGPCAPQARATTSPSSSRSTRRFTSKPRAPTAGSRPSMPMSPSRKTGSALCSASAGWAGPRS